MRTRRMLTSSALAGLAFAVAVFAQAPGSSAGVANTGASGSGNATGNASGNASAAPASNSAGSSLQAGEQLARSGGGNAIAPCASCHGANGEGNPAANFPRIAGQPAYYLAHQLQSFSDGSRENPIMTPIARAMSADQKMAVSDYYAQLQAPAAASAPGKKAAQASDRGRILANVGDQSRRVQACGNCHGPDGIGEAGIFPYLAGQNASYLTSTLKDWREGRRKSDPSGQMPTIAKLLNDNDITAVANYFAAQTPPGPAPLNQVATSRVPSGSGTANSGPQQGSDTSQSRGIGVEQGAPTTGGGQGIGGGGAASGSGPQGSPAVGSSGNAASTGNAGSSGSSVESGNTSGNASGNTGQGNSPNAQRVVPGAGSNRPDESSGSSSSQGTSK